MTHEQQLVTFFNNSKAFHAYACGQRNRVQTKKTNHHKIIEIFFNDIGILGIISVFLISYLQSLGYA